MTSARPSPPQVEVLSRSTARSLGVRVSLLLGQGYQRVFYDTYVSAGTASAAAVRSRAALSFAPPGSHVSHHTAAQLWGVWVPHQSRTHISVPAGARRPRRAGVASHEHTVPPEVTTVAGLPVSTPAQLFLDLAGQLDLVDLVCVGDALIRRGLVTPEGLLGTARGWRGKGAVAARRAATLCRAGVDSAPETRLRLLVVLAGLPEPTVNLIVRDEHGAWVLRFDLSYPGYKLALEYDGRQHAESDRQWQRDIDRREWMDRNGWRLVVVRSRGLWVEPAETLQRIRAAMVDVGMPVPAAFSPGWQAHFPGRESAI
ncbi:MAG TPA: hypothetical protein VFJ97_05660 [Dermatophilaceae bacterium]|nr:hypothetical protein [Dermatophilaceae bacterium]